MKEDKARLEKYRDEVWKKSQYYDGVNEFINDKYHFHNYVDVDIEEKADLPVIDQVAKYFNIAYTIRTSDDSYQVVFNMFEHYRGDLLIKAQQAYHENYCRYTKFGGNLIDYCLIAWILGLLFQKYFLKYMSLIAYRLIMWAVVLVGIVAFCCKKYFKYKYQKKIDENLIKEKNTNT